MKYFFLVFLLSLGFQASAQIIIGYPRPVLVPHVVLAPPPILVHRPVYPSYHVAAPIAFVKNFNNGNCVGRKLTVMSDGAIVTSYCNGGLQAVVGRLNLREAQSIIDLGSQIQNTNTLVALPPQTQNCGYSQNQVSENFVLNALGRFTPIGGQRGCEALVPRFDKMASEQLSSILTQLRIKYL